MDLDNNSVGYQIYERNPYASDAQLAQITLQYLRDDPLKIIYSGHLVCSSSCNY